MAFQVININEIEVGDPIKAELFNKIKNSLDDLDSRTTNVEAGVGKVIVFDYLVGNANTAATITGIVDFEAYSDFTLTYAAVQIYEKGSLTGNLEIDVKLSTTDLDDGSFNSVFSTLPSIDYSTASDYDKSTNAVFSTTTISTGDYLRLDITELPSNGAIGKFRVLVYGELS